MVTAVEGCNEFCTFCIVPYTRGRELSRTLPEIVKEVRHLAEAGIKEIELLGQTINAYQCPETGADFALLLAEVAAIPGLARVRYITSHPRHFNSRLIEVLADNPRVSRYLHLPFQAGANEILDRMHRGYTREEYLELVATASRRGTRHQPFYRRDRGFSRRDRGRLSTNSRSAAGNPLWTGLRVRVLTEAAHPGSTIQRPG